MQGLLQNLMQSYARVIARVIAESTHKGKNAYTSCTSHQRILDPQICESPDQTHTKHISLTKHIFIPSKHIPSRAVILLCPGETACGQCSLISKETSSCLHCHKYLQWQTFRCCWLLEPVARTGLNFLPAILFLNYL